MYPTLFTTTLVFALAALRVRADFDVDTVELTQVSDSPMVSPFFRFHPLICLVWITVQTCHPQLGQDQWSLQCHHCSFGQALRRRSVSDPLNS